MRNYLSETMHAEKIPRRNDAREMHACEIPQAKRCTEDARDRRLMHGVQKDPVDCEEGGPTEGVSK